MSRTLVTVALLLLPLAAPGAQNAESGSITGEVKLKLKLNAGGAALPSTAYPTRAVGPRSTHPIAEITNVIVFLKDAAFRGTLAPRKAEIRQEHETFVPHVVALTKGSSLDFPNGDPIYHNVFSLSSGSSFNLGRCPSGESRSRTFPKAGIVKVYCRRLHTAGRSAPQPISTRRPFSKPAAESRRSSACGSAPRSRTASTRPSRTRPEHLMDE